MIAGVQIALSQPIRLDDMVAVDNEFGQVEEINATYVVLKLGDEGRMVVPLTRFIEQPFINWTRTGPDPWLGAGLCRLRHRRRIGARGAEPDRRGH